MYFKPPDGRFGTILAERERERERETHLRYICNVRTYNAREIYLLYLDKKENLSYYSDRICTYSLVDDLRKELYSLPKVFFICSSVTGLIRKKYPVPESASFNVRQFVRTVLHILFRWVVAHTDIACNLPIRIPPALRHDCDDAANTAGVVSRPTLCREHFSANVARGDTFLADTGKAAHKNIKFPTACPVIVNIISIYVDIISFFFDRISVSAEKISIAVDNIGVAVDSIAISVDNIGVAVDSNGVSVNNILVSVDNIGISVDNIGIAVDSIGIAVDNIGIAVDSIGVAVDSIGVAVDNILVFVDSISVAVDRILVDVDPLSVNIECFVSTHDEHILCRPKRSNEALLVKKLLFYKYSLHYIFIYN